MLSLHIGSFSIYQFMPTFKDKKFLEKNQLIKFKAHDKNFIDEINYFFNYCLMFKCILLFLLK